MANYYIYSSLTYLPSHKIANIEFESYSLLCVTFVANAKKNRMHFFNVRMMQVLKLSGFFMMFFSDRSLLYNLVWQNDRIIFPVCCRNIVLGHHSFFRRMIQNACIMPGIQKQSVRRTLMKKGQLQPSTKKTATGGQMRAQIRPTRLVVSLSLPLPCPSPMASL